MEFSDILASSIHDIKNSLGLILNTLDDLANDPANHFADPKQASLLKHEVQRANGNLLQLLTLYKLGNEQLAIRIAEYNVQDLFDELIADVQTVCDALGLELTCDCDPLLSGYFDWELVRGVLLSAIGNAQRYARAQIRLSAEDIDSFLVIRVEDDGDGFPDAVLKVLADLGRLEAQALDFNAAPHNHSHTRLGLYFASRIAQLHRASNQTGQIQLRNAHQLSGGCFELWLP